MLSVSGTLYPVDEDITEFDLGSDVSEYEYDGRSVFRGNLDPTFSTSELQVYWLYDDYKRVGLVEHTSEEDYTCYWFRDNVWATLLQEDWTSADKTLWNIMSEAAYEDCMKNGWDTVRDIKARTSLTIVTPVDITKGYTPVDHLCVRCGGGGQPGCTQVKKTPKFDVFSTIFVDDDGVIYVPPSDTRAYATLRRTAGFLAPDDGASTTGSEAVGVGAGAGASDSSTPSVSSASSSSAKAALAPPEGTGTMSSPSS